MPRYIIERHFPDGLEVPITDDGASAIGQIVANNADEDVTWVTSYVSADHSKSFCVYDGPTRESIRQAAARNELPVDSMTEVQVLDPYFYVGSPE